MSDNKKFDPKLTNEILLADAMIRLTALERVLIRKGIISSEEFTKEVDAVANQVSEAILNSVTNQISSNTIKSPKDALVPSIDELIDTLSSDLKKN